MTLIQYTSTYNYDKSALFQFRFTNFDDNYRTKPYGKFEVTGTYYMRDCTTLVGNV